FGEVVDTEQKHADSTQEHYNRGGVHWFPFVARVPCRTVSGSVARHRRGRPSKARIRAPISSLLRVWSSTLRVTKGRSGSALSSSSIKHSWRRRRRGECRDEVRVLYPPFLLSRGQREVNRLLRENSRRPARFTFVVNRAAARLG